MASQKENDKPPETKSHGIFQYNSNSCHEETQ